MIRGLLLGTLQGLTHGARSSNPSATWTHSSETTYNFVPGLNSFFLTKGVSTENKKSPFLVLRVMQESSHNLFMKTACKHRQREHSQPSFRRTSTERWEHKTEICPRTFDMCFQGRGVFASQDWLRWQKLLILLPIHEDQNTNSDKISARRICLFFGDEAVLLSCFSASSANYFQLHAIN